MAKPQVIVTKLLGDKYKGLKMPALTMISRVLNGAQAKIPHRDIGGRMIKDLREAADAFYDGDPTKVDEFFQLYCLDDNRPE